MAPKKALSAGHVPAWCCNRYSSVSVATFSGCDERRVASSPKRLSLLIGPPILPIQQQGLTAGNCNIGRAPCTGAAHGHSTISPETCNPNCLDCSILERTGTQSCHRIVMRREQ